MANEIDEFSVEVALHTNLKKFVSDKLANVGKTTLARTLLSQSVGEVRDEPHVTDTNDRFELAQTP